MDLLLATNNPGKIEEMRGLLVDLPVNLRSLDEFPQVIEPIESGATFEENARLKARYYSLKTGLAALADDSGLEVEALGGAPGIYSARYAGENASSFERIEKLLKEIEGVSQTDRMARFVAVMAITNSEGEVIQIAEGICNGTIAEKPRGSGGFGYDPVFVPDGYTQTFGELTSAIKDSISHRSLAITKIIVFLRGFMGL